MSAENTFLLRRRSQSRPVVGTYKLKMRVLLLQQVAADYIFERSELIFTFINLDD
jgi:hypothetical protein